MCIPPENQQETGSSADQPTPDIQRRDESLLLDQEHRLLSSQVSNYQHERVFCHRCLNHFQLKETLDGHLEYCSKSEEVKIEMPVDRDGNPRHISFKNINRKMQVPFVVYADFESYTEKIATCSPDGGKSYTKQYQKHRPSGFSYLLKCFDDNLSPPEPVTYKAESPNEDVAEIFVDMLEADIKKIYNRFKLPRKVEMTAGDSTDYESATFCHICEGELGKDRVMDHCHLTGRYRGAVHNGCNLNDKIPKFFRVNFHNLSGYDAHLFIKNLGTSEGKINCIPNNEEKYILFTKQIVVGTFTNKEGKQVDVKREIRFIDSFKFMATILDRLVANLPKEAFKNLGMAYEGEQLELMSRKVSSHTTGSMASTG